jgi:hypothetical protein
MPGLTIGKTNPRTPFWDASSSAEAQPLERIGPWESVQLGGFWLPGICEVRSPGSTRRVVYAAGPGDSHEEKIDTGAESADVQIIVTVWTRDHLAAWESFHEHLEKNTGTRAAPKAMDIVHPGLNLAGVAAVYVLSVSVLESGPARGTRQAVIVASEFAPRKRKSGTVFVVPSSTAASPRPTVYDSALDAPDAAGATP